MTTMPIQSTTDETTQLDQLDRMIAADEVSDAKAAEAISGVKQATDDPAGGANYGQRAATKDDKDAPKPDTEKTESKPKESKSSTPDAQKKEEAKEPSRYDKAKEREASAWKKVNAEKEQITKDRAEIAAQKAEIEAARNADPKYSADDYADAADRFERQGKFELADEARSVAERMRKSPPAAAQNGAKPAAVQAQPQGPSQEDLQGSWLKAKQEFPEIMDASSKLNASLRDFVKANPWATAVKDGPFLAAQHVRNQIEASRVPDLLTEVKALRDKVKEFEALTSLPGGGLPNGMPREKAWGDKSLDEQEAELEGMVNAR